MVSRFCGSNAENLLLEINWNEHEWVKNAIEILKKTVPQYSSVCLAGTCLAVHRLKLTDDVLWATLQREAFKCVNTINPKGLAAFMLTFLEVPERCSKDFKLKLMEQLPRKIKNMNPGCITKIFELTIKNGLLTEYLFEDHFYLLFWRRNVWFGPKCYPSILKSFVEINHSVRWSHY